MKKLLLSLTVALGLFAISQSAFAHPYRTASPQWHYQRCDDYTWRMYPQWYYGFHGRYLQNLGYPSGDQGLRGAAW